MKLHSIALLICSIFLLSACQEEAEKQPVKKDPPTTEVDDNPVEQETMPIEKIKEMALYSWEVVDGEHTAELYLVEDEEKPLAFYLAEVDGAHGVLQEQLAKDLENVSVNFDESSFQQYTFGDKTMITWIAPDGVDDGILTMWSYTDGKMRQVTFDDEQQLSITGDQVKFIEDHYLQTYIYHNDGQKGIGWFYTTWQWNAANHSFTTYDTTQYVRDDAYGWESGEYHAKLWHEHEAEYIAFPHITLTNDFAESVKKGMLLENTIHLGKSIDEVLNQSPDYLNHDYYEGGLYYAFPGGSSYFYDEQTRKITFITLNGGMVTNDIDSIISIFGKPVDSGYDDIEVSNYTIFHVGDYRLKVDSDESGKVTGFWLATQQWYVE
ncbi:hypothetical protein [Sporosarcina sp. NPDC096371]|uniref:hypothetical protein n=1 Tax=Sporosarcina sp. NPDC096371 TaxID=3364530 RepID=UPI00382FF75F